MSKEIQKWKEYRSHFLKVALINIVTDQSDYEYKIYSSKFLQIAWKLDDKTNLKSLVKIPKISITGNVRLILWNKNQRIIIISNEYIKRNSPFGDTIEEFINVLTPKEFKWPRGEGFDYDRKDWKLWLKFKNRIAYDFPSFILNGAYDSPQAWGRHITKIFDGLLPLSEVEEIFAEYNQLGFQLEDEEEDMGD